MKKKFEIPEGYSEATARRHIKKAQEDGIIKSEDNLYILADE